MIHNFNKSLELSHQRSGEGWWLDVYKKAFPNLLSSVYIHDDGWAQRGGIDRILTLSSGRTILIDEKVRENDWPDILLEYWSDEKRRKPGWVAKNMACDFIAYAFMPSETCYLLPFHTLRSAWRENCRDWVGRYKKIKAINQGYVTVSVAVPVDILLQSMINIMKITWGADK